VSVLSIDFETRATFNLLTGGVYPYAAHPDTDIWCMAWAFDDEEPEIWTPDDRLGTPFVLPPRVIQHLADGGVVRAHNAAFERTIWREIMERRYGAPPVALEQWVCSAAEAAAMALPRHLEGLAKALRLDVQKDMDGNRLMLQMTKPREVFDDGEIAWWDEPGSRLLADRKGWTQRRLEKDLEEVRSKRDRLHAYCAKDVATEQAASKLLRPLTPAERGVWLLDQRINDRGVTLDRPLALAARDVARLGSARANETLRELTAGDVDKVTNHGRLKAWLGGQGVETEGVAKKHVRTLLERDDLPGAVRAVLDLRLEAGKSSVAKIDTMLEYADPEDDRMRGMLFYHAASTGRWGGRGPQPQNFPRPEHEDPETLIPHILRGDVDLLDLVYPPVQAVVDVLRSMMIAGPGQELVAADFAAIEARVLNWLAGQHDVVASFRRYDAAPKAEKPRFDPYRRMAVKMGRAARPEDVTKEDRQAGKAAELGCGFQMGWKKFITAAWDVYGVRVSEPESRQAVDAYRESHAAVRSYWYDTESAAIEAVDNPGRMVTIAGGNEDRPRVRYVKTGSYLVCILPSGRPLYYAAPDVRELPVPWADPEDPTPQTKRSLTFMGVNPLTHVWGRQRTYGGHLVENIVQAVARDLLAAAMLRAEARGYTPILTVHDELVSEVAAGWGSVEEFERLMAETPAWAEGCPVAAEGWRGPRYRK
jgi:DNA polymerase